MCWCANFEFRVTHRRRPSGLSTLTHPLGTPARAPRSGGHWHSVALPLPSFSEKEGALPCGPCQVPAAPLRGLDYGGPGHRRRCHFCTFTHAHARARQPPGRGSGRGACERRRQSPHFLPVFLMACHRSKWTEGGGLQSGDRAAAAPCPPGDPLVLQAVDQLVRHRLCVLSSLPSRIRHRLCLLSLLPSRIRHHRCLACSHCLRG